MKENKRTIRKNKFDMGKELRKFLYTDLILFV